ncbi:MAG TPA: OmpA family protein [Paludibaculum sp.]|jgi:outer membrane protein OmpA-like peptidoglycan-associated protein
MKTNHLFATIGLLGVVLSGPAATQVRGRAVQTGTVPVYKIEVVSSSTKAINYRHRSGSTTIGFKGTAISPRANGEAKVESKKGYIEIEVEFDDLQKPRELSPEFLTYVLWAITPEGRAQNLGELLVDGNRGKLNVTTELQAFGLIVTAEPYFAVTAPSDTVVLENVVRPETRGQIQDFEAKYELLKRGQYVRNLRPETLSAFTPDGKIPLELVEARNAILIARGAEADRWAAETFEKAVSRLKQAEDYHARKQKKPSVSAAREAVQTAEDARLIAVQRIEQDHQARERAAAAQREADATARADEEAARRAQADRDRQIAEQERLTAEKQRLAAEQDRSASNAARQAALDAQRQAQSEADRARQSAEEANRLRAQAEQEKAQLRERLLQQLNMVLQTRSTARGLIVNMSDVLFDTARFTLKPGAREKLAKIAGIVVSHPGLKLQVEGHTDRVGTDDYNLTLSENRAGAVRDFLVQQGIAASEVASRGFGKTRPVVSNDTAAGRQQNRRVEIVVSGSPLGIEISDSSAGSANER